MKVLLIKTSASIFFFVLQVDIAFKYTKAWGSIQRILNLLVAVWNIGLNGRVIPF